MLLQSPARQVIEAIAEALKNNLPAGTLVRKSIYSDETVAKNFYTEAKESVNDYAVFVSYLGSGFNPVTRDLFDREPRIGLLAIANDYDIEDGFAVHDLIETCLKILYDIGLIPIADGFIPFEDTERSLYAGFLVFEINTSRFGINASNHTAFTYPDEVI